MTLSEFKAWFDGYTENMSGPPDEKQWDRIKKRMKDISHDKITEVVYRERYRKYFDDPWVARLSSTCRSSASGSQSYSASSDFDSHTAMFALGKRESLA